MLSALLRSGDVKMTRKITFKTASIAFPQFPVGKNVTNGTTLRPLGVLSLRSKAE